MRISIAGNPINKINKQRGFSYVLVLIALVVTGIMLETAAEPASRRMQAEREQELLLRGMAYQKAIRNYYLANRRYPARLSDLVKDSGFVHRVYLRDLYADPMAAGGKGEWNVLRAIDGGIAGVASQSIATPMKQANFPQGLEHFNGAARYADWVFDYQPKNLKK